MLREDMMERMSMEEFLGWMAYSELEPFGDEREDLRAGVLWSLLATVNSDTKKHPRGIGIDKYPLIIMRKKEETTQREATPQSLFRLMKALADGSKKPS